MITRTNIVKGTIGFFILLFLHGLVVAGAGIATKDVPINGHVVALSLLGFIQAAYAIPIVAVFAFKRNPIAVGALICAALTLLMSIIALSR